MAACRRTALSRAQLPSRNQAPPPLFLGRSPWRRRAPYQTNRSDGPRGDDPAGPGFTGDVASPAGPWTHTSVRFAVWRRFTCTLLCMPGPRTEKAYCCCLCGACAAGSSARPKRMFRCASHPWISLHREPHPPAYMVTHLFFPLCPLPPTEMSQARPARPSLARLPDVCSTWVGGDPGQDVPRPPAGGTPLTASPPPPELPRRGS